MTRIAELDDLDRDEGRVVEQAHFERMAQAFDTVVMERLLAEQRADAIVAAVRHQRMEQRALLRMVGWWVFACATIAAPALYLKSIGQ